MTQSSFTLTPSQISAAVAEDGARGVIPTQVQKLVNTGEMYLDLSEVPTLKAKLGTTTKSGEIYDADKLKNAAKQASKTARDKALLAGNTSFPEITAIIVTDDEGTEHVLLVNQEVLAKEEAKAASEAEDADEVV